MTDGSDRPIGYGRPPANRQFGQPGGNRRGRGRASGSRNVSTIVEEALTASIMVKDGGKRPRRISKLDASLTQLANKAATGDLRAIQLVIGLAQGLEAGKDTEGPAAMSLSGADRQALDLLVSRVRNSLEGQGDE